MFEKLLGINHCLLCISTNEQMLAHGFAWSKTMKNIGKLRKTCQPFNLFVEFFEHIFEHINVPLSGLKRKTKKCRSEE